MSDDNLKDGKEYKKKFPKGAASKAIALTLLLFTIALLIVVYTIVWHGCIFGDCAVQRNFTELDLEIPDGFFPRSTTINKLHYVRNLSLEFQEGQEP